MRWEEEAGEGLLWCHQIWWFFLQNASLKARLLEFCNEQRNFDFHLKEKLTHAVASETWQ